ncbi:MAG: TIGR02099 family protein [Methylophaga sp.]|nr:TIGR02099 family protein [Methylophaga sp.]
MSILKRTLHVAGRHTFYWVAIATILCLLALLSAVWLSNAVAERKDEIARWTGDKLGYPIEIGEAGLYWLNLFPKLYLADLQVAEAENAPNWLEVEQLQVSIDLLASLRAREPVMDSIKISGLNLNLGRNAKGKLFIASPHQPASEESFDTSSLLRLLNSLELERIKVTFRDQLTPTLDGDYQIQRAQLHKADNAWQVTARLALPAQMGSDLELQALLELDEQHQPDNWQFSLMGEYLQLDSFRFLFDHPTLSLDQTGYLTGFRLDAEKNERHYQGNAEFSLNQTVVSSQQPDEDTDPIRVERLTGQFHWQFDERQWSVSGDNLRLIMAGESWPETSFSVSKDPDGWFDADSQFLRLSDLSAIAVLLEDMPEWLQQQRPAGDMHRLKVRFHPEYGLETAALSLENVAFLPWQDWPGLTGLSADIDWQAEKLSLELNSKALTFYPQDLLPDAVYLDSLSGAINWQVNDDGWLLAVDRLHLWNDDLNLQVMGTLQQQQESLFSDITVNLQDVIANRWLNYVPESIVDEDFFEWAAPAFIDGIVTEGSVVVRGNLAEFPFDDSDTGAFLIDIEVENATLLYADGWPELKSVSGQLNGDGNQVRVSSQSGTIAGLDFIDVNVLIENVIVGSAQLNVIGDVEGDIDKVLNFLNASPLKPRFGPVADAFSAQGSSQLSLVLDVPLADPYETLVKGRLDLTGTSLNLVDKPGLGLQQIEGVLDFDNDGVSGEAMKALIFGAPAIVDIQPQDDYTLVTAKGSLNSQAVIAEFEAIPPGIFNGLFDFRVDLAIREFSMGDFNVDLEVSSDLKGLQIDMPEPFGKAADEARPLRFSTRQTSQGPTLSVNLDKLIDANWRIEDKALLARVELGGGQAAEPMNDFVIRGQLSMIDVQQWLDWSQLFAGVGTPQTPYYPDLIDLQVDRLALQQQQFEQVNLQLRRSTDEWKLNIGSEKARGEVVIPDALAAGAAVRMDFDRLVFHWPEAEEQQLSQETESLILPTPRPLWPSMNVQVRDFQINDMRLGEMHLFAQRAGHQWQLEKFSLSSEVYQFNAEGIWQQLTAGDVTRLSFETQSNDLRGLLASFGYQQAIEANQAELQVALSWPGDPLDFSQRTMEGSLMIDVGSGRLLDIEPGAAGRIFGLLSFAALPRRLLLDFSDFFGKGMGFSGINGNFTFAEGIAVTDNLVMRGDSANIAVTGSVNLIERTYKQKVRVTPSVSSTLPLAGAVAGGPVGLAAGTAIFLADRIAGRLFDRDIVDVISYSYDLTGPWDDPELKISRSTSQKESQPASTTP